MGDGTPRVHLRSFHELMHRRVRRILLVSSLYDSFVMAEEGQLQETLLGHFLDLNVSQTPDLVQVSSAAAALSALADDGPFDLVVASLDVGDANAAELQRRVAESGRDVPVVALANTRRDLHEFTLANDTSGLTRTFLWQGDVRLLFAIVKSLEDWLNVENDTGDCGVPAIILVEDSVRFYSSFLPAMYSEVFRHSDRLLSESLSASQRMIRMRARPKILLCNTYEEAWGAFDRYCAQVLGVVSDVEFPRGGEPVPDAGLDLCRRILEKRPEMELVVQSSRPENRPLAEEIGAEFLLKGSPTLLHDLRRILVERLGFGDFVFRLPDRTEVARAADVRELAARLRSVAAESIAYHADRNRFSSWLRARTEFALAERLAPYRSADFADLEQLRECVVAEIDAFRIEQHRTVITSFDRDRFEPDVTMTRIGAGSLGGKARGVAFANRLLHASRVQREFPDVELYVPPSVVLATDVFEEFLEYERIRDFAIESGRDDEIVHHFRSAPFPRRAISDLQVFLHRVKHPLAVRSSSLLEDSLSQPFAGVYQTFMVPNNDLSLDVRWHQLADAVKRVYASTFLARAKAYLSMTSFRLEEEKMAVMVQQLVGTTHGERFYPDFAGVARSLNSYPEPGHAASDGVAAVALGLGQAVVGGDPCLRFSPKHPQHMVRFSSVEDALENSQRDFHALDLAPPAVARGGVAGVRRYELSAAEADGVLSWLGSTYVAADDRIVDGVAREGTRLVTFAQILKHDAFPLAEILVALLERCEQGTGAPVEIEFAGTLGLGGARPTFALLQLRPLALSREQEEVTLEVRDPGRLVCHSARVLGNGVVDGVRDLVVVDPDRFERQKSHEVALEVARYDALLRKEGLPYLLIGVGRWGSSDPFLGIPVSWNQIAGARAIVEAGFADFRVAPSQGTHFFQNLTSSNVAYFTVNPDLGEGRVDWGWLAAQPAVHETEHVRHVRLEHPVRVVVDGRSGEGVIEKPPLTTRR